MIKIFKCLGLLLLLSSCQDKEGIETYHIDLSKKQPLTSDVVFTQSERFSDFVVTADYIAFLNSDTIVRYLDKQSMAPVGFRLPGERESEYISPVFINYDYANEGERNAFSIWDKTTRRITRSIIQQTDSAPSLESVSEAIPVTYFNKATLLDSRCYAITKEEFYAVPVMSREEKIYYFYSLDSGYYWIDAFPQLANSEVSKKPTYLYASHLWVNGAKETAVIALRHINSIQFYDLRGNMKKAVVAGEAYHFPSVQELAEPTSLLCTKYFIDIAGNNEYVCCLYEGSKDFSNASSLVVFNWKGKHLATYQTDRHLLKIRFDPEGKSLYAYALSEEGEGTILVKYNLPF